MRKIMKQFGLNMENYQKLARQAAAEGCVLLENRNHALPLEKEERIFIYQTLEKIRVKIKKERNI